MTTLLRPGTAHGFQWLQRGLWAALGAGLALLLGPYLVPLPAQPDRAPEDVAPLSGRFVTVSGVRTFVQEAGPSAGPAVVLVHGFGGSTFNWRFALPALAQAGYHAVALDLKGFGLADKSFDTDYSHAAQADFVAAVMSALGIQRATLVGHSMGGNVVAHFALRYPQRVEKLVFASAMIIPPGEGGPSILGQPMNVGVLTAFPPFRRWGQILLRTFFGPAQVTATLKSAYFSPAFVTPDVIAGALRPQTVRDWDLALLGIVRDSGRNALPQPVSAIAAPILLVWGEQDTWVPLARGQRLRAALPQAQWVQIARAGHLAMEEQAAVFNAALIDFLGSASGTSLAPQPSGSIARVALACMMTTDQPQRPDHPAHLPLGRHRGCSGHWRAGWPDYA